MPEDSLLSHESLRQSWSLAAQIVEARPWLTISWIAHPDASSHLVVHDGPTGASLHFDDEGGPTFASAGGILSLEWDDVAEADAEWMEEWGPADPNAELTAKTAAYRLLSEFAATGSECVIQPARFIGDDGDPSSIYSLQDHFPTIKRAVESYAELLEVQFREGEIAARPEYWHEPIWLVTRAGRAVALVDESGELHASSPERSSPSKMELVRARIDLQELARRIDNSARKSVDTPRRASAERPALRVHVDLAAILSDADLKYVRAARAADPDPATSKLPWVVGRDFAEVFGDDWWSIGFPGSLGRIIWTLYIDADRPSPDDLVWLTSASNLVGFFFAGGRLLVDRFFDGDGCDVLVTRGFTQRIRHPATEVVRLGAPGTEDWRAVADVIERRVQERDSRD